MLYEIAITPSVFLRDSYEHQSVCDAHMQGIWEALTERLLIRNLWDEGWFRALMAKGNGMPFQAQKLIKHLKDSGRLIRAVRESQQEPNSQPEWCEEAL